MSFDEDGAVIEFNQAAEQTFGHARARALGCLVDELLFPPAHRSLVSRSITAMRVSGQATTVGHRIEASALHADSHEIPVELSISGARIEGRCIFTAFLRDVGLAWLALGVGGLLFRTVHLFFLQGVGTGLVWMTKILTDPFHDAWLYRGAPLALLRGEWIDPMPHAGRRP